MNTLFAKSIVADHIEEGWKQKARQRSSHLFGGQNFVQFLATLAVLSRSIWKKRLNSTVSFNWLQLFIPKSTVTLKTASAARNQTNVAPQTDVTTFAYAFCFHPSFMWQTLQLRNISPRSSITWKVYKIVNSQKVANTQIWTRTRKFQKKDNWRKFKNYEKIWFLKWYFCVPIDENSLPRLKGHTFLKGVGKPQFPNLLSVQPHTAPSSLLCQNSPLGVWIRVQWGECEGWVGGRQGWALRSFPFRTLRSFLF